MMELRRRRLRKLCESIRCNVCCIIKSVNIYVNHTVRHSGNSSISIIVIKEGISAASYVCKCFDIVNVDNSVTAEVNTDKLVAGDNGSKLSGSGGILDMEHTLYLCTVCLCVGSVSVNDECAVGDDNFCAVLGCDLDALPLGVGEGTAVKHNLALKSDRINAGSLIIIVIRSCKVYVLEINVCSGCNGYMGKTDIWIRL